MTEISPLPRHLALIPDGNRRWARGVGVPAEMGHRAGYINLTSIGQAALALGVEYVTGFALSSDNLKRDKTEVDNLMELLLRVARTDVQKLSQAGARVRFIGDRHDGSLSTELVQAMQEAEDQTRANTKGTMVYAINYDGRREVVRGVERAIRSRTSADQLDAKGFTRLIPDSDLPDVDLLIRTSERRLNGFMLWQAPQAEIRFDEGTLWPDFNLARLHYWLEDYAQTERRFGGDPAS